MPLVAEMNAILNLARRYEASDIHIVAGLPPMFRISGEIILADAPPLSPDDTKRLTLGLLNDEQKKVFERDWQICCSIYDPKLGRFRVAVYNHANNPEMSIRMITNQIKTREQLRLPPQVEDLTRITSGLILVTGPTGSGKTTTLNYMVDLINSQRRCKIIMIEDPVEYIHARKKAIIVQQELYADVKSFSSALIHVLRQDPDVICVGEMRDYETTATALMAAETGHLVIATCHTPNTYQTVERIVSIFPGDQQPQVIAQLANCLQGVVAQRLLPSADKKTLVLANELLMITPAAKHHIRQGEFHLLINVVQTGGSQGLHTMDDSIYALYQAGEITYDIALNNSTDAGAMKQRIHGQ